MGCSGARGAGRARARQTATGVGVGGVEVGRDTARTALAFRLRRRGGEGGRRAALKLGDAGFQTGDFGFEGGDQLALSRVHFLADQPAQIFFEHAFIGEGAQRGHVPQPENESAGGEGQHQSQPGDPGAEPAKRVA
jgi:hypothetical protein